MSIQVCMHACMYVCMYVCMYACTRINSTVTLEDSSCFGAIVTDGLISEAYVVTARGKDSVIISLITADVFKHPSDA